MFCTNCGKEIINTARFCNFCGKPVINIAPIPPVSPISSPISSQIPTPTVQYSAPIPETNAERYASSEDVLSSGTDAFTQNTEDSASGAAEFSETGTAEPLTPETENPIPDTSAANTEPGIRSDAAQQTPTYNTFPSGSAYPMPNVIPQSGSSVSGTYSAPGTFAAAPSKPERERKYTLGHIMLCLAATAVMAITAGVFAGLYFSVV